MAEEMVMELAEWTFPELEIGMSEVDADGLPAKTLEDHVSEEEATANTNDTEYDLTDRPLVHQEMLLLKTEFEERISVLNTLLNKLKNPTSILDEELIELIQDITRKIVKKIIGHEIKTDSSLLLKMINELKGLIDNKNGVVNICMSAVDFNRLDFASNGLAGLVHIDHTLNCGDMIIKSNFAEVRALLDERIEQLIRIEHE